MHREAAAMTRVDHPNVIRLYDAGENFGQAYLIAEFVDGGMTLYPGFEAGG
jgi:serine/threonine protein kinase